MYNHLDEIVQSQKHGEARGITSICSAHPWGLLTAMRGKMPLLIESTCNQVNQYGGYTGMTPSSFFSYVRSLAGENNYPVDQLILGGDHLGPSVWQNEPAEAALQKSRELVKAYVEAGYTKLHIDTSMKLGDDDPTNPLDVGMIALRTARLVKIAESISMDRAGATNLRYVIGSEVPPPGGSKEHQATIPPTNVEDVRQMLEVMQAAFLREGLEAAWERVIALVVQPGVEFGNDYVVDYNPALAQDLVNYSEGIPFVYEAHSTDYQTSENLRRLVQDHFAILKVGPALTFAFREAVFSLVLIENELIVASQRSNLMQRLDLAMQQNPVFWEKHYRGTPQEIAYARKYSLSDRIRYYWAQPGVQEGLSILLRNLGGKPLPLSLVSQYFPRHYSLIREGNLVNSPQAILAESVNEVLEHYLQACGTSQNNLLK